MNPRKRSPRRDKLCIQKCLPCLLLNISGSLTLNMTRHPPRLTVITDLTIVQPSKEISNERIAFGICKDLQADTAW